MRFSDTFPGDALCTILGANVPLVLRPTENGTFCVIGECYFHGLMHGESLLDPLPSPWTVVLFPDENVRFQITHYWNPETETLSIEDPRLGKLSGGSERIDGLKRTPDDPLLFAPHRSIRTGEVINWDPRMSPEALEARGVDISAFTLV